MSEGDVKFYRFGNFQLDLENMRLLKKGIPISITQKSFEVLQLLVENRGQLLKKQELLDHLWVGDHVEEANLTQQIYMLRKILNQGEHEATFIETIPKNGYRFTAEVERVFVGDQQVSDNIIEKPDLISDKKQTEKIDFNAIKSGEFEKYSGKKPSIWGKNRNFYIGTLIFTVLFTTFLGFTIYLSRANSNNVINKHSIAVLPFQQFGDEKDEKLGIGIADVLIARLSNTKSVDVRPTSSIIQFADKKNYDLPEIGKNLDVNYIVAGNIQRDENSVRVTAQFYNVKDKTRVWIVKFDENKTDVFKLQDRISEQIVKKILSDLKED